MDGDNDNSSKNWRALRISKARKIFLSLGFEPIVIKLLRKIFQFSFRVMNAESYSFALNTVTRCISWRNDEWWKRREGLHEQTRDKIGRPQARWEDIFCKFAGTRWMEIANGDRDKWKLRRDEFVKFGYGLIHAKRKAPLKPKGDRAAVEKKLDEKKKLNEEEKTEVIADPWLDFAYHDVTRLELVGDSMLVVSWLNGIWPMKDWKTEQTISQCMVTLWKLHVHGDVWPRRNHSDWARQVPRKYNKECDELATMGKALDTNKIIYDFKVEKLPRPCNVLCRWDGGYNPDDRHVGIGIFIQYELFNVWHTAMTAYGRCAGDSAVVAELIACQTLVHVTEFMLNTSNPSLAIPPAWRES